MKNLRRLTDGALRIPTPQSLMQSESEILARIEEIDRRGHVSRGPNADLEWALANGRLIYQRFPKQEVVIYKSHVIAWGEDMLEVKNQMGESIWNSGSFLCYRVLDPDAEYCLSAR